MKNFQAQFAKHKTLMVSFVLMFLIAAGSISSLSVYTTPAVAACPPPLHNCVDTSLPSQSGETINVPEGGNFQAALNQAQLGDTIVLARGATYTGPFTLPKKSGNGWIVIRSSDESCNNLQQCVAPAGTRVSPANAFAMPKIVTTTGEPAIKTARGAHHYRLVGIEIASHQAGTKISTMNLVQLGESKQTAEEMPHHIIFDRVYAHGNPTGNMRRGIMLNGAYLAVINSYVSEVHEIGADAQAVAGWNGTGPFKIVNNYLEGAGENAIFGGAKADKGLNPMDLEFRQNYSYKPLEWRKSKWTVKNLFELKDMRRALVDGNIFENNWAAAQTGSAILFTPLSSQSGPDAKVTDVVFSNNIIRHAGSGFNITGSDYSDSRYPNQGVQTERIRVYNNLFEDISSSKWGGNGWFALMTSGPGPHDFTFDHNTVNQTGNTLTLDGHRQGLDNFAFTNNVINHNKYGVIGSKQSPGKKSLDYYLAPGFNFSGNVLVDAKLSLYPAGNYSAVSAASDAGANRASIEQATAGVIAGNPGNTQASPPPTTPSGGNNNGGGNSSGGGGGSGSTNNGNSGSSSSGGGGGGGSSVSPAPVYAAAPPAAPNQPGSMREGRLVKNGSTIYIIENGKKRGFTSMAAFSGLGYKLANVVEEDASQIPEGPVINTPNQRHPRGSLVNDRGTIYFLGEGLRYPFLSAEVFFSWGHKFSDVLVINSQDREMPVGPIVELKK